jgi:3-methyl-2-oxobutanoate hydroxymethyltransferase
MSMICKSRTYQLSLKSNKWNEDDKRNYSHAMARRLPAEALLDAVYKATGATSNLPGLPAGARAAELSDAGAAMAVLELVPSAVAREITAKVAMATIGIGAGQGCSGQVLVLHDMLGVTQGKLPRFVRNFMDGAPSIEAAIARYVADVKSRTFPDDALHGY